MDNIKYIIASNVFRLAQFLDKYFYYILTSFVLLTLYNTFIYKDWDSLLFKAAGSGNIEALQEALKNDADVNSQPAGECTPLIIACLKNQFEVVKILIETKRCKLEFIDSIGRSALYCACQVGNLDILKLLIENKAKTNNADNNGNSPLIIAAGEGRDEVVKYLLQQQVEIAWKNKEGFNALSYALQSSIVVIAKYSPDLPDAPSKLLIMQYLLEHSSTKIESTNKNGWTALLVASYRGYTDVIRLLINHRANVNFRTENNGFTPLIAACQNGWKEVVKILVDYGADVDLKLNDGSNAFIAASSGGYHEIVEFLGTSHPHLIYTKFKAGSNALLAAVVKGYISVAKVLISLGVDINAKNNDGWNALILSCQHGYYGILKLLLENKADIHCSTSRGFTPLMYAIKHGYTEIASTLIEHGATINHFDLNRDTNLLIKKQDMPLIYGYITPIMLAIARADEEIVNLLLKNEADIHIDLSVLIIHGEFPSITSSNKPNSNSTNNNSNNNQKDKDVEKMKEEELQLEALNDATFVYSYCSTPFLLAVYLGNLPLACILLAHEEQQILKHQEQLKTENNSNSSNDKNAYINKYMEERIIDQRNSLNMGVLEIAARNNSPAMFFLLINHRAEFDSMFKFNTIWVYTVFISKLLYRLKIWSIVKLILIIFYRFVRNIFTFGSSYKKKNMKKTKSD